MPFALLIALVNALVVRTGATVLVQGWNVPVFGRLDITLEAAAYGGVLGLRALVLVGCGALLSARDRPRRAAARVPPPRRSARR